MRVTLTAECRTIDRALRRRGAYVFAVFGFLWAMAGSSIAGEAAVAVLVVAAAISVAVAVLGHRFGNGGAGERRRELPEGWGRSVGVVNILQIVAIAAAVFGLSGAGFASLIPPVVCLIVGLHFIPLARLYDQRQYRWTAGLLSLVALLGLGAVLWGAGTETVLGGVGLASAVILWGSAAHVAIRN